MRCWLVPAMVSLLSLGAHAQTSPHFEPPDVSTLEQKTFWATTYWVHHAVAVPDGVPLRDDAGANLGPLLSQKDWCMAALEGTVRVEDKTYNYSSSVKTGHVDCSQFFKPDVGYSRWKITRSAFGDGTGNYILVPYRTIAADPAYLKPGTVLFIPAAVGQPLPDGSTHDGYFFVGDVGGAIKGNHIDVFQGDRMLPFSFILSKGTPLFVAYIVRDPKIVATLEALHKMP